MANSQIMIRSSVGNSKKRRKVVADTLQEQVQQCVIFECGCDCAKQSDER